MIDSTTIDRAANRLLAVAPPGSRVFLFGSHATGRADHHSDIDFLIVEPQVGDRVREMLRLSEALRPLRLPVDLMVLSSDAFETWRDTPNSLAYRVAKEGRLCGSAA